jgi:hypothetical protein
MSAERSIAAKTKNNIYFRSKREGWLKNSDTSLPIPTKVKNAIRGGYIS